MNKKLMEAAGFTKELQAIKEKKCPTCGKKINMADFRDMLDREEFRISGMCQECQDNVFGKTTKFHSR